MTSLCDYKWIMLWGGILRHNADGEGCSGWVILLFKIIQLKFKCLYTDTILTLAWLGYVMIILNIISIDVDLPTPLPRQ